MVLLLAASVAQAAGVSFVFAGLSLTPEPWNKEANFAKLERYARQAAERDANVIATPEGFLEGCVGNDKRTPGLTRAACEKAGEALDGPMLARAANLARELKAYLLIGFAGRRDGKTCNTAAVFSPGGAVASRYAKSRTAADEPFNAKGSEFIVANTKLGRWGTLICFDRQFPGTARILALKGAQFIFVPAWGGYGGMNDMMMRLRAYENGVWLAFVRPERCLIIDPRGRVVAQNSGEEGQTVAAAVTLPGANPSSLLNERRPELYGEILRSIK